MAPLRLGVWGVGTWGEKHARVLRELGEAVELAGVHDRDRARAEAVAGRHGTRAFAEPEALLEAVDALTIAVPTVDHRVAAEAALGAGKHVLVEKPMAVDVAEADAMLAAAQRANRSLQVGQVERFNPAVAAARPHLSEPKFIEAHRLALFQPRSLDIDVVFDLMIHDIDLVLAATGQSPSSVSAVGVAVLSDNEDIANARLEFPDGCVANLTASRVSQDRLRRIRFFLSDAYLSLDLSERAVELLRIEPRARAALGPGGAGMIAALAGIQRSGLEVGGGEPLFLEIESFVRSLKGDGPGAASGWEGREALRVAQAVREQMRRRSLQWSSP